MEVSGRSVWCAVDRDADRVCASLWRHRITPQLSSSSPVQTITKKYVCMMNLKTSNSGLGTAPPGVGLASPFLKLRRSGSVSSPDSTFSSTEEHKHLPLLALYGLRASTSGYVPGELRDNFEILAGLQDPARRYLNTLPMLLSPPLPTRCRPVCTNLVADSSQTLHAGDSSQILPAGSLARCAAVPHGPSRPPVSVICFLAFRSVSRRYDVTIISPGYQATLTRTAVCCIYLAWVRSSNGRPFLHAIRNLPLLVVSNVCLKRDCLQP